MAESSKAHFTETLRRLLRVSKREIEQQERRYLNKRRAQAWRSEARLARKRP